MGNADRVGVGGDIRSAERSFNSSSESVLLCELEIDRGVSGTGVCKAVVASQLGNCMEGAPMVLERQAQAGNTLSETSLRAGIQSHVDKPVLAVS